MGWTFYSARPVAPAAGFWATAASAAAHLLFRRRRARAALFTGVLVALWPRVEERLVHQPTYRRLVSIPYRLREPIERFRNREERRAAEERHREMVELYGPDYYGGPGWELGKLRRVISVGRSRAIEGITLTLLSVESYDGGYLAHTRIVLDQDPFEQTEPSVPDSFPPDPKPLLTAHDDRGGRYPMLPNGGSSSGREWRWEFRSARPHDPEAGELTIEVARIRWERHGPRQRYPVMEREQVGPWTFTVAL